MARIKRTGTRSQAPISSKPPSAPRNFVRVKWQSRTAAIVAHDRVQDVIDDSREHFRLRGMYVLLGELEPNTGEKLEITDGTLGLVPRTSSLTLEKLSSYDKSHSEPLSDITLHIASSDMCEVLFSIRISPSRTGNYLRAIIAARVGKDPDNVRVVHDGVRLSYENTLASHGIESGDEVQAMVEQVGGKPVIYLFPPKPLPNASISVTLVPQWTFTHIYPFSDGKVLGDGRQHVSWEVSANPDGKLVQKKTGLETSYLFWEAVTDSTIQPSLSFSSTPERRLMEAFEPAHAILEPDSPTSVMLPFPAVIAYIERALTALTLHTAARTEFITHWIPALSRHSFVALRFLPQSAYERTAELSITPKPDVVTRVFMLFRGVCAEDTDTWSEACSRTDTVDWAKVVGVKRGAWDLSRFRALEWGAMELVDK